MAKLSDFKNEEALDLMVEIIDPISEIATDKEFIEAVKGKKKMDAVKIGIGNHKKSIIKILAALEGVPANEYSGNPVTMTKEMLELLNDKEIIDLFQLQGQIEAENASGSATESTEASEK